MNFLVDNQLQPALARFIQAEFKLRAVHVIDVGLRDASDEYIHYITCGVRRMAALIDGVLIYSRVDAGSKRAIADTSEALRSAVADLSHAIEESLTVVTHDPSTAPL